MKPQVDPYEAVERAADELVKRTKDPTSTRKSLERLEEKLAAALSQMSTDDGRVVSLLVRALHAIVYDRT